MHRGGKMVKGSICKVLSSLVSIQQRFSQLSFILRDSVTIYMPEVKHLLREFAGLQPERWAPLGSGPFLTHHFQTVILLSITALVQIPT